MFLLLLLSAPIGISLLKEELTIKNFKQFFIILKWDYIILHKRIIFIATRFKLTEIIFDQPHFGDIYTGQQHNSSVTDIIFS